MRSKYYIELDSKNNCKVFFIKPTGLRNKYIDSKKKKLSEIKIIMSIPINEMRLNCLSGSQIRPKVDFRCRTGAEIERKISGTGSASEKRYFGT